MDKRSINKKWKSIIIYTVFILLIYIYYEKYVKCTIGLYDELIGLKQIKSRESAKNNVQVSISRTGVNSRLYADTLTVDNIQQIILTDIVRYCQGNEMRLISLPTYKIVGIKNRNYITYNYQLESSYYELTKYIYYLEKRFKYGRLASIEIFKSKKQNQNKLISNIIIQIVN